MDTAAIPSVQGDSQDAAMNAAAAPSVQGDSQDAAMSAAAAPSVQTDSQDAAIRAAAAPSVQTTLCYVERDGAYLMLHRNAKPGDVNAGKWIGVGGKFEPDESPEECMLREVLEETGLYATEWGYRGIVTFISPRSATEYMHLFTISAWTGKLKNCDEGTLEWVPKERLLELPHWEGDEVFLGLIANLAQPFFSLKLVYDGNDELIEAVLDGAVLDLHR